MDAQTHDYLDAKASDHHSNKMPERSNSTPSQRGISEDVEKTPKANNVAETAKDEEEYVTGIKLYMILAAMVLVTFVMMLDLSVIGTVR